MMGRPALAIIALLALVVMATAAGLAGFVGSDDTVFNRPAQLGDDGRPVLTAPDLLAYDGVIVTLRASAPNGVFIGTAHPVDVADFVDDSSRVRLTSVTRTGVVAEDVGTTTPVNATSADFWITSMRGEGVEELTLDRDSAAAQWVIAPLGGDGPTTVSIGVTIPGVFRAAVIGFSLGAMVLLASVEMLLRSRRKPRRPSRAAAPVHRGGKRRAQRTALAAMLALSFGGCTWEDGLLKERQSSELAQTKVALTRAEVPALLKSYDARLSTAIRAARGPRYGTKAWRLADRGVALESDLFGTRVGRLTRLGNRSVPSHDPTVVFSPRFASYPMWSMVGSKVGREERVDLFSRASVQSDWLRQAGTQVSSKLPAPGRPGRPGRPRDAATATAAWRDYLRAGVLDDRLRLDQASRQWRTNIADLGSRAMFDGYRVSVGVAVKHGLPRVVEVEDGVLAIVALRMTTRLDGRPDLMVRWNPPYGLYRPSAGGVLSFADVAVGVIHLPTTGAATVLGSTFSEVAVERRAP